MSLLHKLFPQVRAEILRLLFAAPDQEMHVRELGRQSNLHVKTVADELAKLASADLVASRRDGNRLYFRANVDHPVFGELRQIVLKTAGLADVLRTAVNEIAGIDVAFVFGSLAANAGKARSDVDLFIIGDSTLRRLAPALRSASTILNREINPITITRDEFVKTRKKNPFIVDILGKPKLFVIGNSHELERLG